MPRVSLETRRRIVAISKSGYSVQDIQNRLAEENIYTSKVSIYKILRKYQHHGIITDFFRRSHAPKLSSEQLKFIDDSMARNDEITGRQMRELLREKWPSLEVSISTVKRERQNIGWVSTRPKYCQLVREINMEKRFSWCKEQISVKETFDNVIFTDECSVQLDNHGRLCFRKKTEPKKLKPRPKHPIKVHVWGGISKKGATSIVIFTGTLTAIQYCTILDQSLKPFIEKCFPDKNYRFQQDNDPKHCSNYSKNYFLENNINWWRTPPESPDLNPIENVWGSLKYFLRHSHKPKNLDSLIAGILLFWKTLTPEVCSKYISHLNKVMPKVVEVNGAASGY